MELGNAPTSQSVVAIPWAVTTMMMTKWEYFSVINIWGTEAKISEYCFRFLQLEVQLFCTMPITSELDSHDATYRTRFVLYHQEAGTSGSIFTIEELKLTAAR